MKILNLYAGIGGNRKLWGDEHEIIAVEYDPKIAAIYQDFFPKDKVVVGDAHQYLLDHFEEFEFIWASPPCPTHSDIRRCGVHKGHYSLKVLKTLDISNIWYIFLLDYKRNLPRGRTLNEERDKTFSFFYFLRGLIWII